MSFTGSKKITDNCGFSLIEALIVLLIVAIFAVLAVPRITSSLRANRINTVTAAFTRVLADARSEAIKRNARISVVNDLTNKRLWIQDSSGNRIGGIEGYDSEVVFLFAPSSSATQETITFNSFGGLVTPPGTVAVQLPVVNRQKVITLTISGKASTGQIASIS